ncbi:MAG: ribonuclease H family protein, partial [Candidatus Thiodiazotropha taylori]
VEETQSPLAVVRTPTKAFDTLKEKLSSPILAYADFTRPFILHTDASTEGLGAVLYQVQDGLERVIAYASRGLRNSERNYPAHKLEFLCLKWAVTEKFHDYLYGNHSTVVTDNNPLTYVLSSAKLDATGHRWLASLGSYNFELSYRSGRANADADGLSRRPPSTVEMFSDVVKAISQAYTVKRDACPYAETLIVNSKSLPADSTPSESTELKNIDWAKEQSSDVTLKRVIQLLRTDKCRQKNELMKESPEVCKYVREWQKFSFVDNVLYRNTVIDGEQLNSWFYQIVLKTLFLNICMMMSVIRAAIVHCLWFVPGSFGLGWSQMSNKKLGIVKDALNAKQFLNQVLNWLILSATSPWN